MRSSKQRLEEFLFPADSDTWLGILRIGVGLQVIIYCLSLRTDWTDLFSLQRAGLIKRDLSEAMLSAQSHYIPRLGWLVDFAAQFGGSEQAAVRAPWWGFLWAPLLCLSG